MTQTYLSIADHLIALSGDALLHTLSLLDGFRPFMVEQPGNAPLAHVTSDCPTKAPEFTQKLYHNEIDGFTHDFGRYQDGYIYESITPQGEVFRLWMPKNGSTVYMDGCMVPRIVRFALWMAYGWVTNPHDTIAIHTSCIVWEDRCVIFLGESGTGKSTHTRLWR